jgi:hypothetical protein
MKRRWDPKVFVGLMLGGMLLLAACAAGDPQYTAETPAGFWHGLWHGIISVITLIIGLFNENVEVYERFNTGAWYDAGFLFGVLCVWGGGSRASRKTWPRKKTEEEKEWEEIGKKVEKKIRRKIREWAEAEPDEEWEVVGKKAEAKLKKKLRAWAEDEPTDEQPMLDPPGAER